MVVRLIVAVAVASGTFAVAGCGSSAPPPATGEAFKPPPEMEKMKNEMMERYKSGAISKAPNTAP